MPRAATITLLLLVAHSAAAAPTKLTLTELRQRARQYSKAVATARAGLDVRQAQKGEALALWAPVGEITYLFTATPAIQCRGPGGNADPTIRKQECVDTVDPNTGQSVNGLGSGLHGVGMEGELKLIQPVYTFGKIEAAIEASHRGIDAARAAVDIASGDADLDVARAYWGTKAARTAILTLDGVRDELGPWIDKIEKNLDKPKPQYTISDLERLKTALDELDIVKADLDHMHIVALAGLRALTGEEVDVDDGELDAEPPISRPLAALQEYSLGHRPEMRALDAGVGALQQLARVRRNQMLPDIGIAIDVLLRYSSSVETPDNTFMFQATVARFAAFLALRQPLDLFQRHAQYRVARAEAHVFEARRDEALIGMDFQLRSAYAEQDEARRRLAASEHGQKTARGWLNAVKQNLDLGTADPRDLADAARRYLELRLGYFKAIADANITVARLNRLTGME